MKKVNRETEWRALLEKRDRSFSFFVAECEKITAKLNEIPDWKYREKEDDENSRIA